MLDSKFAEALFLFYASSGLRKGEVLGLTVDDVDFEKRMIVHNCHAGGNKRSYVSFYNRETAEALKRIDMDNGRLFSISDRQYKKIWRNILPKSTC